MKIFEFQLRLFLKNDELKRVIRCWSLQAQRSLKPARKLMMQWLIQQLKEVFWHIKSWLENDWRILRKRTGRRQIIWQFWHCFLLYSQLISRLLRISIMLEIYDCLWQRNTSKPTIQLSLLHLSTILSEKRMRLSQSRKLHERLNILQTESHSWMNH